jgi:hypothetical protein
MLWLTLSYDIACQWKIHVAERMTRLPAHMQLDLSRVKVQYGLPVWHAASHTGDCQEDNSLSFKPGVGKTDGEGIERTWAVLNPAALATKEMSLGNRADALDDRIDNHNFLKNLTHSESCLVYCAAAIHMPPRSDAEAEACCCPCRAADAGPSVCSG